MIASILTSVEANSYIIEENYINSTEVHTKYLACSTRNPAILMQNVLVITRSKTLLMITFLSFINFSLLNVKNFIIQFITAISILIFNKNTLKYIIFVIVHFHLCNF